MPVSSTHLLAKRSLFGNSLCLPVRTHRPCTFMFRDEKSFHVCSSYLLFLQPQQKHWPNYLCDNISLSWYNARKNHPRVRHFETHAVGSRVLKHLIQNILSPPPTAKYPHKVSGNLCLSLFLCLVQELQQIQTAEVRPASQPCKSPVCNNKTTNGQTFAPLIFQGPSVLCLSRVGEMDGEPSFATKKLAHTLYLSLLPHRIQWTKMYCVIYYFYYSSQNLSINFTHIIPT